VDSGRYVWIQVARGTIQANETELQAGDGLALANESSVRLSGRGEALLFDMN
jgi:hypothetical protein